MNLKRLKNNLLHVNNLRKFVGFETFGLAIKSNFKLQILEKPPRGKVLVLSPHPDDDIIGCGGVLSQHSDQKDIIKIIYLTDGSGGIDNKKQNTREQEAINAAKVLKIKDLMFWRFPDGKLNENRTTKELLTSILKEFKPDTIYAPSFLDPHPDHFETAKILASALKESKFLGEIFSYEVWSPIYANKIINIDKAFEQKKEALTAQKSQITSRGYLNSIIGLAQYRAGMYNAGQYAEAFFSCKKELYLKLFDLINFKKTSY